MKIRLLNLFILILRFKIKHNERQIINPILYFLNSKEVGAASPKPLSFLI